MPQAPQPRRPLRRVAAAVLACGLAALVAAACIVAPPPDLPPQPVSRPTILHDAVTPPADAILTPADVPPNGLMTFVVPVELNDPNSAFSWEVFVDYDAYPNAYTNDGLCSYATEEPTPGTVDGGTVVVPFSLHVDDCKLAAPYCHRIEFVVAYSFSAHHVPDSIGGDNVLWWYNGAGGTAACPPPYDASAFGEGGLPMMDAASEHPPIAPESGSDP
jgi:hypothetical protein